MGKRMGRKPLVATVVAALALGLMGMVGVGPAAAADCTVGSLANPSTGTTYAASTVYATASNGQARTVCYVIGVQGGSGGYYLVARVQDLVDSVANDQYGNVVLQRKYCSNSDSTYVNDVWDWDSYYWNYNDSDGGNVTHYIGPLTQGANGAPNAFCWRITITTTNANAMVADTIPRQVSY